MIQLKKQFLASNFATVFLNVFVDLFEIKSFFQAFKNKIGKKDKTLFQETYPCFESGQTHFRHKMYPF
jgi:hypothetical protein